MIPTPMDSSSQPASPASVPEFTSASRVSIKSSDPFVTARGDAPAAGSFTTPGTAGAPVRRRPFPASTLLGDFVGSLLDRVAGWLAPSFVERSLGFARDTGHAAVLAGAALTLLYAIFAAIKFNAFAVFLTGLGLVAAIAVAQFAAVRFLEAGVRSIAATPSRISSPAFLHCTGLLLLLAAVGLLLGGLITAIQLESVAPVLPALFFAATCTYVGAVALHPSLVNVALGEGSAGEEAIGLLSFFFKTGLKLVPLFFLLLCAAGDLALLGSFFAGGQGFASALESILRILPLPVDVPYGLAGSAVVLLACLLPLAAYFAFLLQYLVVDLLRAVLCLPAKLDALKQ